MRKPTVIAAAVVLLSSAAGAQSDTARARDTASTRPDTLASRTPNEVREYEGSYSSGYEISWFEPCGWKLFRSEQWWVTLTEEARLQRDSLLATFRVRPREGLAVRWLATVGPRMPAGAGHMGRGSRYMLVTKIISLRPLGEGHPPACGQKII